MATYCDGSSSSEEEKELLLLAVLADEEDDQRRRWWVHDTLQHREQRGKYHTLVQELLVKVHCCSSFWSMQTTWSGVQNPKQSLDNDPVTSSNHGEGPSIVCATLERSAAYDCRRKNRFIDWSRRRGSVDFLLRRLTAALVCHDYWKWMESDRERHSLQRRVAIVCHRLKALRL